MATIKDIAEKAGVSIGTVDRIIHKRGRFSAVTAERVHRIMEELDYTPNIHARGLKKSRTHRFAAIIPMRNQDSGYWSLVEEGIMKGVRELSSFGVQVEIIEYDRYSKPSFLNVLEKSVSNQYEGLLLAPSDIKAAGKFLSEQGLPLICIDSMVETESLISYIGQDSHQSGVLSAKLMSLLLKGKDHPEVLIINPPGSHRHHEKRITGFSEGLTERFSGVLIHMLQESEEEEEALHQLLREWITTHQVPDGIFVANSHVYYTASFCRAHEQSAEHIPLIGYDYIPEGKQFITEGIIDFIITQEPQLQGYQGIMNLYDALVLKKSVNPVIHTPLTIITKENLEEYLDSGK